MKNQKKNNINPIQNNNSIFDWEIKDVRCMDTSFFQPANKIKIKKDCVSLQVHKSIKLKEKLNMQKEQKRACLCTLRGSITLEAAIATTILIFFLFFFISFLTALYMQASVQIKVNNISTAYAKKAFYLKRAKEAIQYKEETENTDETIEQFQQNLKNFSFFIFQADGLNFMDSRYENGMVDVVVKYQIKVPYVNLYYSIRQRSYLKDWSGTDIAKKNKIVYITETGKVYHTTKNCSHLAIHIKKTNYENIQWKRNNSGAKYAGCSLCAKNKLQSGTIVFFTEDGTKYHTTLMCSKIRRTIIEADMEEVKDMRACLDCAQEGK